VQMRYFPDLPRPRDEPGSVWSRLVVPPMRRS